MALITKKSFKTYNEVQRREESCYKKWKLMKMIMNFEHFHSLLFNEESKIIIAPCSCYFNIL